MTKGSGTSLSASAGRRVTPSTRAPGGPVRSAFSSLSSALALPAATSSTSPDGRLRTQPASLSARACWRTNQRYPTPCTRPATSKRSVGTPSGYRFASNAASTVASADSSLAVGPCCRPRPPARSRRTTSSSAAAARSASSLGGRAEGSPAVMNAASTSSITLSALRSLPGAMNSGASSRSSSADSGIVE